MSSRIRSVASRIGDHELRLQVFVQVATERIRVLGTEVGLDAADRQDQASDDVLVFRGVHVVAQVVGGGLELGFETEIGCAVVFLIRDFALRFYEMNACLAIGW